MKCPRRQFLHLVAGAAALPVMSRVGRAQAYPTRPITLVVPFPAGGSYDTIARILAEPMRASLGWPVIIENITGAGGSIGAGRVARAAPDGYTIAFGDWSTHVANGAIYALQYDMLKDFEPIAPLTSNAYLIAARRTLPANDLKGLVAWLKANPNAASAGTLGMGTGSHVMGIQFQSVTGTRLQLVPYRGGAPAIQDLVAGQIDLMIQQASLFLPHLRDGKIKAFAVLAKSRLAQVPDIPTVDEAGLPGFYFSIWQGLWAPKGTPQAIIARLNGAVVHALADSAARQRLADLELEIPPREQQTPEALGALQNAEIEKWWPIVKAVNIKGE